MKTYIVSEVAARTAKLKRDLQDVIETGLLELQQMGVAAEITVDKESITRLDGEVLVIHHVSVSVAL